MTRSTPLFLYEEIMLLMLRNEKGTVATGFPEYAVAGAALAELLLDGRISIDRTRKPLVDVQNTNPTGDPILDECLERLGKAKRRASLNTWVTRLAGIKDLWHKVARQLCRRGILRADEDAVLFFFTRKTYPEIDPEPEQEILERVRRAIFTDQHPIDARTVVLISLADGADLLRENFGAKEIKPRRKRIEQIVQGEMTGNATKEVIVACQTAVIISATMPAIIATTINN